MIFKIQGLIKGNWHDDAVGNDSQANEFDTQEEATAMIPSLAKIFNCSETDFRVVECD